MRISPAIVLGVGLGSFADGIALHQIAQWHNMGSAILPPTTMEAMHINMRWDGYFHVASWLITALGAYLLWRDGYERAAMPSLTRLVGQFFAGWGLFNIVEGVIDHHLLELHHVRDMPAHVPSYDWLFLAIAGLDSFFSDGSFTSSDTPAH